MVFPPSPPKKSFVFPEMEKIVKGVKTVANIPGLDQALSAVSVIMDMRETFKFNKEICELVVFKIEALKGQLLKLQEGGVTETQVSELKKLPSFLKEVSEFLTLYGKKGKVGRFLQGKSIKSDFAKLSEKIDAHCLALFGDVLTEILKNQKEQKENNKILKEQNELLKKVCKDYMAELKKQSRGISVFQKNREDQENSR